jgi:2-polyprenyl-3-methyl-5-hydroxy-6-metoxy-1,4-benzoquinol methylase
VWLYGLSSTRYNGIKDFDRDWEIRFLGEPVAKVIGTLSSSRLLDVGAGTGRLAWALEGSGMFSGNVVCAEASRAMIRNQLPGGTGVGRDWLQSWEARLPFADGTFDLVASLEMLEFTPDPRYTMREMARVLRPGGWLLVSNRVGWQAPLILGKTFSRRRFPKVLTDAGLEDIEVFPWQMDYDLAWARRPSPANREGQMPR